MAATKRAAVATVDLNELRLQLEAMLRSGPPEQALSMFMTILERLMTENRELATSYAAVLRQMYRRKSEKISPDQLALFLAQLPASDAARAEVEVGQGESEPSSLENPQPSDEPSGNKGQHPRRSGRKALPAHLRREIVEIPLPDAAQTCAGCGQQKANRWFDPQEMLDYKPAEFFVIEYRREIRSCRQCQEHVSTAPSAPKPIEGGRPGPGLLAHIVTSKCNDGLPLYRQSQIMRRSGIELADSTLGAWFSAAADLVEPLFKEMKRQTLSSYLLSLDDTGMPVQDREHPNGIKRGHIWTYLGDSNRIGFCEFTPDWKGKWPITILEKFSGEVIQSDGYSGIDAYFSRPRPKPIRRAGCMDHCRRKFRDALDANDLRAAVVISLLRDLYLVEEHARAARASLDDLAFRRRTQSRPIIDRLGAVIADLYGKTTPKSLLGKALTYAINQWPTLIVFLDDPRVPLSNAHVERQQRKTALGRKAYLFAGSIEAGHRLATLQTLILCCELAGAPPFEYLRDIFGKLAADWPAKRIEELLPAAWLANQRREQAECKASAILS